MENAYPAFKGRIYDIGKARKGGYVLRGGKRKSKKKVRERLNQLEGKDVMRAGEILGTFDNFYLGTHKDMYNDLKQMWRKYKQLSERGKKAVQFGMEDASGFLFDFYKDRAEVKDEKYDFVCGVVEKLEKKLKTTIT